MKKKRSRPSPAGNDGKPSPQSETVRLAGEKYQAAKAQVKQAKLKLKQARSVAKELKRVLKSAMKDLKGLLKDASRDQKKAARRKGNAGPEPKKKKATGQKSAAPAMPAAGNAGRRTRTSIPSVTPPSKLVKPKPPASKPGRVVSSKVRKTAASPEKISSPDSIAQAGEPPEAAPGSTLPVAAEDQAGTGR